MSHNGVGLSVLAKSEILRMVDKGVIEISPFEKSQVGAGSVDLHLGNEFRVFKKHAGVLDVSEELSHNTISSIVVSDKEEGVVMEPGDFINGITEETIRLPQNISGRIEGRSRFARIGLLVHVSSGFVQPGSNGKVVLEIANLSKVKLRLKPGVKICQIVLEEVKGTGSYEGHYSRQEHP